MEPAIDKVENETPNTTATLSKSQYKKRHNRKDINGAQRRALQRIVKPTGRQQEAARIRSENPTYTDKEVLLQAGYDYSTATVPSLITGSIGYIQSLAKYGLTEELITSSLVEDIQAKPQKRVRELELGADILSMRKRPVEPNNIINIALFSTEQQNRIAQRIIENLAPNNAPNKDDTSIN